MAGWVCSAMARWWRRGTDGRVGGRRIIETQLGSDVGGVLGAAVRRRGPMGGLGVGGWVCTLGGGGGWDGMGWGWEGDGVVTGLRGW